MRGARILAVDDPKHVRLILGREGFETIEAPSAEDALPMLRAGGRDRAIVEHARALPNELLREASRRLGVFAAVALAFFAIPIEVRAQETAAHARAPEAGLAIDDDAFRAALAAVDEESRWSSAAYVASAVLGLGGLTMFIAGTSMGSSSIGLGSGGGGGGDVQVGLEVGGGVAALVGLTLLPLAIGLDVESGARRGALQLRHPAPLARDASWRASERRSIAAERTAATVLYAASMTLGTAAGIAYAVGQHLSGDCLGGGCRPPQWHATMTAVGLGAAAAVLVGIAIGLDSDAGSRRGALAALRVVSGPGDLGLSLAGDLDLGAL